MNNRYKTHGRVETQFEPGSNGEVLRNLLGVTSKQEMDQLEYELLAKTQLHYIEKILTAETAITVSLICQMHFDWLGTLYEWAGKYRTVNISKGDFKWPPYGYIQAAMTEFEPKLLDRYIPRKPMPVSSLALQMAEIHAEFLIIHPFRDGNGRIARWIADIVAMQADFPAPEYDFANPKAKLKKENYIQAVRQGYNCDFGLLTAFFRQGLEKALEGSGDLETRSRTTPSAPSTIED